MRKKNCIKNFLAEFAYEHQNVQKKMRKICESVKKLSNMLDKMDEKTEK